MKRKLKREFKEFFLHKTILTVTNSIDNNFINDAMRIGLVWLEVLHEDNF